jgi:hypothetical protein
MTERELQQAIRLALGRRGGTAAERRQAQNRGRTFLTTGLPPGTCDLLFIGGGHAVFIEVKTPAGRLSQRSGTSSPL